MAKMAARRSSAAYPSKDGSLMKKSLSQEKFNQLKKKICQRLLNYDPGIVEIVQFGSSVYAPQYARDLDLLVITREEKDYGGYLDCLDALDSPFDVDVVIHEVGDKLRESFALQVMGSCEILYGSGEYLRQMVGRFNPNFEEARAYLRGAREDLELAKKSRNRYDKDMRVRTAFNALFHAARTASMAYLATEESRWGKLKKELPHPYKGQFEEFIKILHLRYFYDGAYPDDFEAEFDRWHEKVEDFVKGLERAKGDEA
jgi:predicted nucleotidyltransferase